MKNYFLYLCLLASSIIATSFFSHLYTVWNDYEGLLLEGNVSLPTLIRTIASILVIIVVGLIAVSITEHPTSTSIKTLVQKLIKRSSKTFILYMAISLTTLFATIIFMPFKTYSIAPSEYYTQYDLWYLCLLLINIIAFLGYPVRTLISVSRGISDEKK